MKTTLKEIRKYDKREEFFQKLKAWQVVHHCSGVPNASELGLKRIAYSIGKYGISGTLYIDMANGDLIGVPCRSYNIYIY